MKNKGFTIVELLAVIVLLGILSSIAMVSVSKYREDARKTDLLNLHGSVEVAYDKYRQDKLTRGESYSNEIKFSDMEDDIFESYFSDFTFDGKILTRTELSGSSIELVIKGELLNKSEYCDMIDSSEIQLIKDGVCMIDSTYDDESGAVTNSCKKEDDVIIPSQEEMLCIVIKRGDEEIINDYSSKSKLTQRPLCEYFSEGNNGA